VTPNLRGVWVKVGPLPDPTPTEPTCPDCYISKTDYGVPMVPHVSYPQLFQCPSCGRVMICSESLT